MYLRAALPCLDKASIQELQSFLREREGHDSYVKLLQAIEKGTAAASLRTAEPQLEKTQIVDESTGHWRRGVRDIVQSIVEPDDLDWMEDEEDMSEIQFIERALSYVENRFERCAFSQVIFSMTAHTHYRPIYNSSAKGRVALARHLTRLPCALTRHLDLPCPSSRTTLSLNLLKPCLFLVECILDGADNEVTPAVHRAIYVALARSVRHQTVRYGAAGLEHIKQLAARGMKNNDRNVRLNAG